MQEEAHGWKRLRQFFLKRGGSQFPVSHHRLNEAQMISFSVRA